MIRKRAALIGKITLLAGLGLSGLAAADIRQAMSEVRQERNAAEASGERSPFSSIPTTVPPDLPPEAQTIPSSPTASETSAADSKTEPQSKTIAVSAEPQSADFQPNVTTTDPNQLAAAIWAGASFPVENFQAYTSPFGYRRSPDGSYRQEFHYGLDIAAPQGSYIRNWWSGKVVEVSDNTNCGTSVVVESGAWQHIYCHMLGHVETQNGQRYMIDRQAGIQIWQGQDIAAGDRIGRVGMTGRTTGPHLHWGLKYQSSWVDPAWVLQAMLASQHALSGQNP